MAAKSSGSDSHKQELSILLQLLLLLSFCAHTCYATQARARALVDKQQPLWHTTSHWLPIAHLYSACVRARCYLLMARKGSARTSKCVCVCVRCVSITWRHRTASGWRVWQVSKSHASKQVVCERAMICCAYNARARTHTGRASKYARTQKMNWLVVRAHK